MCALRASKALLCLLVRVFNTNNLLVSKLVALRPLDEQWFTINLDWNAEQLEHLGERFKVQENVMS